MQNKVDCRVIPPFARGQYVLVLIVAVIMVTALLLPTGFTGTDDYRYLIAAERWLNEGVHTGANHWANRLPYVLSLVASFAVFGETMLALTIVNAAFFAICCYATWHIGCHAFADSRAALFGVLIILSTPLLIRQPTYFYPEVAEMAFLAITALIVIVRRRWITKQRIVMLLLAGFVGGLAMLVRQTAVAVPVALAAVIFFQSPDEVLKNRICDTAVLALGFFIPIVLEILFYVVMTGDPLHRFKIDSSHVKIANRLKDKASLDTDSVLFNWKLASNWERQSAIPSHWTITPFVRLLLSPGMLLIPWIGIVGGVLAWRTKGHARTLAILTLLIIVLQYLLNTFVIVLPPNTRYFGIGLVLLALLAGYALAQIHRAMIAWTALFVLIIFPALLVLAFQPSFAVMNENLSSSTKTFDEPVYLPGKMLEYTAIARRSDPNFRGRVALGAPPILGLMAVMSAVGPENGSRPCNDKTPAFELVRTVKPNSPVYSYLEAVGFADHLPDKVRTLLEKDFMTVRYYRRLC